MPLLPHQNPPEPPKHQELEEAGCERLPEPPRFHLGTTIVSGEAFVLTPDDIAVDPAVLGTSSAGKSRFADVLAQQLLLDGLPSQDGEKRLEE